MKKYIIFILTIFLLSCITGYTTYMTHSHPKVEVSGVIEDLSYLSDIDKAKQLLEKKYNTKFVYTGQCKNKNDITELHFGVEENPRIRLSATVIDNDISDNFPEILNWNAKNSWFGNNIIDISKDNYIQISQQIVECLNFLKNDYIKYGINLSQIQPQLYLTFIHNNNYFSAPFVYGESAEGIKRYFERYIIQEE